MNKDLSNMWLLSEEARYKTCNKSWKNLTKKKQNWQAVKLPRPENGRSGPNPVFCKYYPGIYMHAIARKLVWLPFGVII